MRKQLLAVVFLSIIVTVVSVVSMQNRNQKLSEMTRNHEDCQDDEYVPYKQIITDTKRRDPGGPYKVLDETPSKEHLDKVMFVLDFYNIKQYKEDEKGLKILCPLWKDKDLLANITSKAKDSVWLRSRMGKP
jgi:hypothetical protein